MVTSGVSSAASAVWSTTSSPDKSTRVFEAGCDAQPAPSLRCCATTRPTRRRASTTSLVEGISTSETRKLGNDRSPTEPADSSSLATAGGARGGLPMPRDERGRSLVGDAVPRTTTSSPSSHVGVVVVAVARRGGAERTRRGFLLRRRGADSSSVHVGSWCWPDRASRRSFWAAARCSGVDVRTYDARTLWRGAMTAWDRRAWPLSEGWPCAWPRRRCEDRGDSALTLPDTGGGTPVAARAEGVAWAARRLGALLARPGLAVRNPAPSCAAGRPGVGVCASPVAAAPAPGGGDPAME